MGSGTLVKATGLGVTGLFENTAGLAAALSAGGKGDEVNDGIGEADGVEKLGL